MNGRRLALLGGFCKPFNLMKGGLIMVTYSDLIQFSILIVSIVGLVYKITKK